MKKISLIIATIIFLLLSGICNAEPDSTIKYLMNEPVSMLDFGLYRMDRYLEIYFKVKGNPPPELWHIVHYRWDENRIIVACNISLPTKRTMTKKDAMAAARDLVGDIRHALNSPYTKFFSHYDFSRSTEPKKIAEKLIQLVEIRIAVYHTDGGSGYIQCTAPLRGKDIYFKE
jgi:hypothetical protein